MKKWIKLIVLSLSLIPYHLSHSHQADSVVYTPPEIKVEYLLEFPKGTFSGSSGRKLIASKTIPKEYILAMIAIHECINTQPQDAPYIIQASYNRELINHGRHGDIYGQVLSSEYKGLLDRNYYFNPYNSEHMRCLQIARDVLAGKKYSNHRILGWVNFGFDNDYKFLNRVKSLIVPTEGTFHQFWAK